MKFIKYFVPFIFLLLCLLLNQKVSGDAGTDMITGALPLMSGLVPLIFTGPAIPLMVGTLGVIQLMTKVMTNSDDSTGGALSKNDFLQSQSKLSDKLANMENHMAEAAEKLTLTMESYGLMEDMRNDLDTLQESYADNMKIILNPNIKGVPKQTSLHAMLDYFSSFRQILKSFITKYIKPKGRIAATGDVKLFFDFILKKERIAADAGDDCYLESTHTKIFKSYMYILKILTDAYVMAISAHSVQHQTELKTGNTNEAYETQKISLKLLNQYKLDMKSFMEKTKWALDRASRDIRNCGIFELKRGETYESISFARILPKFRDWNYDKNAYYSRYSGPNFSCYTREQDVKFNEYEIGECTDGGLKRPARVKAYVNSTNSDWPYTYLDNIPTFGADTKLGHTKNGPGLITREFSITRSCYSLFCPAFKKNAAAISTQIVRAQPGNVMTGLRFAVRDNVIYIDCQEGKMLDDLSVDPDTVTWTETPKSDKVLYLSSKIRKIELGSVEVDADTYLTSIQLKMKNEADGIIGVHAGGGKGPAWTSSTPSGSSDLSNSNEVVLSGCDNPEQYGDNVKNIISKPPVPSKPYFVSFQPSDLTKDLGSSTLPFIDLREVVSNPSAPLGGFGIMYQTVKGSGGFLSLVLKASNLSRFIDYKSIEKFIDTTKTA